MLQKMKKWKLWHVGAVGISAWLVSLADAAVSSACFFIWHEPDCPEELLE